jgi:hypothetical protein
MAWLWAWLLSEPDNPNFGRFHWKYHRLVKHDEAERVRALLAACSNEESCPPSAVEMRDFAKSLGLLADANPTGGTVKFGTALEAHHENVARLAVDSANKAELANSIVPALAIWTEEVHLQLREVVALAKDSGLPVEVRLCGDVGTTLTSIITSPGRVQRFFEVECEARPKSFYIRHGAAHRILEGAVDKEVFDVIFRLGTRDKDQNTNMFYVYLKTGQRVEWLGNFNDDGDGLGEELSLTKMKNFLEEHIGDAEAWNGWAEV